MKAFKKLIPAICMLLASAAMLGTSSYAWFSMNRAVKATGMGITAEASSSLVISNTLAVGTETTVVYTSSTTKVIPAVHSTVTAENPSGLKYNSNPQVIDTATGLPTTGNATTLLDVSADTVASHNYYVDYVCYIAASGGEMTEATLKVKLSPETLTADFMKAASIDFYVATNTNTTDTYKGTLNHAGLALDNDTAYDATKTCTEVVLVNNGTIPVNNQSDTWLKITLRCYFDGALLKDATHAYVATDTIYTNNVASSVEFFVAEN